MNAPVSDRTVWANAVDGAVNRTAAVQAKLYAEVTDRKQMFVGYAVAGLASTFACGAAKAMSGAEALCEDHEARVDRFVVEELMKAAEDAGFPMTAEVMRGSEAYREIVARIAFTDPQGLAESMVGHLKRVYDSRRASIVDGLPVQRSARGDLDPVDTKPMPEKFVVAGVPYSESDAGAGQRGGGFIGDDDDVD